MANGTNKNSKQVIVIGGGLSGLSAAHTVLQSGLNVVLLERNQICGGNSTKATSGINGSLTKVQQEKGIEDSVESFLRDTAVSASKGKSDVPHPLARVLVENSASAVHWLIEKFGLKLNILGRLGGHSYPRTHRGTKRFPGMEITYTLMKHFDEITSRPNSPARLLVKSRADKLIQRGEEVVGVEYVDQNGDKKSEYGPVVIATGGFGADFSSEGILANVRPDLLHLPTTNGSHCTGDGIKMAQAAGAANVDLAHVQVHPTGLINPADPKSKTLYLAAEALRGCGALLLDSDGERFADELGRRDYVSGEMFKRDKGPYRLVLNSKASAEIDWHCKHYTSRGLMKRFESGDLLAKEIGISVEKLRRTFDLYNTNAMSKTDPYGKKFFANIPFEVEDFFYVAMVTPVIHYCMGGISVSTDSSVLNSKGHKIPGLFASGEVIGGVHGVNRLGGSSLLDCVVYGRIAGDSAVSFLRSQQEKQGLTANGSLSKINVSVNVDEDSIDIRIRRKKDAEKANWEADSDARDSTIPNSGKQTDKPKNEANPKENELKEYGMEEVGKHTTEDDCWIVVNGVVLDATDFLDDHPGGKRAIMIYAGKDATEEFNMFHEPDVVEKYAPHIIKGVLKKKKEMSKL